MVENHLYHSTYMSEEKSNLTQDAELLMFAGGTVV